MFQRWKLILTNWINCYFSKSSNDEQSLSIESLVTIISHLRENFNLDESKSSLLEAHTVEEFLCEKYPEFKFENGTVEASNDNEICMAASLLLYFVCVNSKNFDIKSAMCSKLSSDDQETILKFSKCLMECRLITAREVQAAVTEACGQDIAAMEVPSTLVSETPPALRSLHGTVRRLQAALDAEKFDRNFLQEEMVRTNNKLERLLKEKEQHKLEILNLKAKISLCCGEDSVAKTAEAVADVSAKLTRQLQLSEGRLEELQGRLDDVGYERDTFKAKVSICSEVCANVVEVQLGEERARIVVLQQQIQALQVQISELNQIREVDKTTLKSTITQRENEICTLKHRINEEIEKKKTLKAHCDNEKTKLNNEINELDQKLKENHEYFNDIIKNKTEDIKILQEEKLSLLQSLSNETTKLGNKIKNLQSELDAEQQNRLRMKESYDNHIMKLNEKMLNRNNEIVEFQNKIFEKGEVIEKLQIRLKNDKEEYSKLITQYESLNEHTTILQNEFKKEKEIVKELRQQQLILNKEKNELQSHVEKEKEALKNILNKYETTIEDKDSIENELAKERAALNDLTSTHKETIEQYDAAQTDLKKVKEAGKKLQNKYHTLHEHNKELKLEINKQKEMLSELTTKHEKLSEENKKLENELAEKKHLFDDLSHKYEEVVEQKNATQNDLEKAKEMVKEFGNKCLHLEEENDIIQKGLKKVNAAFEQLNNEHQEIVERNTAMQFELQTNNDTVNELKEKSQKLQEENNAIRDELNKEREAFEINTGKYQEIVKQNLTMETELKTQKETFQGLLHEYRNLDEHRNTIENDLRRKCEDEEILKLDLENKVHSLKEKLTESEDLADKLKTSYECQIENLNVMVTKLSSYVKEKTIELDSFKKENNSLQQNIDNDSKVIKNLQEELTTEKHNIEKLTSDFESERQVLKNMVTVTESVMDDTKILLNNEISEHLKVKESLELEISKLQEVVNNLKSNNHAAEITNASLLSLLKIAKQEKDAVEQESESVRDYLDHLIKSLSEDKESNITVVHALESQNQMMTENNKMLNKRIEELTEAINNLETELKSRENTLKVLQDEKVQLQKTFDEKTGNLGIVEAELQELKRKLIDIKEENNELKLKEVDNLTTIEELKLAISTLENDLQFRENTFEMLLKEKEEIETELHNLADKLKESLEKNSQVENDLLEKIRNLNKAHLQIDEMKTNIVVLTDENNNLKLGENESITKINELKDSMNVLENELRNKLEIISQGKLQLGEKLQELTDQLKTALKAKIQTEKSVEEKDQELSAVKVKNTELETKIAELVDENNNLKQENSDSVIKLEQCKIKETELEKNLEDYQTLINNSTITIHAVESQLETQKDKMNKALEQVTLNLVTVQKEFNKSRNVMLVLSEENNNLKHEREDITVKLDKLEAQVKDIDTLRKENAELKAAISDLKNDLQAKEDMMKTIVLHKTEVENKLQTYIVQLEETNEKKTKIEVILEETTLNLIEVQQKIKELNDEVTALLNEKNSFELEKSSCLAKIEELNSKIEDLEAVVDKNDELKEKLNILENELKNRANKFQILSDEKSAIENVLQVERGLFAKLSDEKTELDKSLEEKAAKEKTLSEMINKLKQDKEQLQQTVGNSCKAITTLEDDLKSEKLSIEHLKSDFESERLILKNMITSTESMIKDTKLCHGNEISQHLIAKDCLETEKKLLLNLLKDSETQQHNLEIVNASLHSLLKLERKGKQEVEKESEAVRDYLDEVIGYLSKEKNTNMSVISALEYQEKTLVGDYEKMKNDFEAVQSSNEELTIAIKTLENELQLQKEMLQVVINEKAHVEKDAKINADQVAILSEAKTRLEEVLSKKMENLIMVQQEILELKTKMDELFNEKNNLELQKKESSAKIEEYKAIVESNEMKEKEELLIMKSENQELLIMKSENQKLLATIEENKTVIKNLEQLVKHELAENHKLRDENEKHKLVTAHTISHLQDNQAKAEKVLESRQIEIAILRNELKEIQSKVELSEQDSKAKDGIISKMSKEKDAVISTISKELLEEKGLREKMEIEVQAQKCIVSELRNNLEILALKKENEQLIRAIGQQETFTALSQEKATEKYACMMEGRDSNQVDSTTSDNTHTSTESLKTITDLEKIIHDKNRTITTLQTDITYLKSLMAESENKLLDITKELEISKENCQQLSNQLKKIVHQKNEDIADLKKQVTKMSATENRATQIIKVSAKYQAMILKRIAEIKSNTVLKELTNFGNADSEIRRSLAGSVTMEDLENFLETTDRHLKRCSEKQTVLQKERDRLNEVNKIHESEIINLKKFLTELSVSFQTFGSVKDLYGHKLSRVISIQRTVRREILNLDGRISDATMCKLERGYGAVMQDLAECTMNLERWVERCISRTVSVEKIKQAFSSELDRTSLASSSFQNTGLEVQLEELEKSFHKLLEEIARAVKNEGGAETQAATVMEVRAEYEDKLNRMKAKMKELFNEQMAIVKNKQKEEIDLLDRELQKTRYRMEDSKRAYETHIKELTKELWNVGEKYLVKNDEAEWLRRKQRSGSLMSLQHVHSSGLSVPHEPPSRPSDAQSLRSLPVSDFPPKSKRDARGLHMSDEEGEVFDNRCLKELAMTPRKEPPGQRLSELKWRNSLCPPHLKSSYPAETQFAPTLDEDDLKAGAGAASRGPRKEVGITAYKKPGPPTPSKQAGRLSATDSELRESVRVESDPATVSERKTSTPARFRAFLRLSKHDTNEGTPRTRRLSSIFRKK